MGLTNFIRIVAFAADAGDDYGRASGRHFRRRRDLSFSDLRQMGRRL